MLVFFSNVSQTNQCWLLDNECWHVLVWTYFFTSVTLFCVDMHLPIFDFFKSACRIHSVGAYATTELTALHIPAVSSNTPCGRPPCILASLRLTRTTGTLGSRTLSAVSVHTIIPYRRLRRPGFAVIIPFSGVYSIWFMIRWSRLCLLVLFTTSVGSDDCIRLGDVWVRLPLPRRSDSLLQETSS